MGALLFFSIVVYLQWIQPEFDFSNRLISELALHRHGDAMMTAFACLSISCWGIELALAELGASRYLIGLLLMSGISFLFAGQFTLASGLEVHLASVAVAFVALVLVMYLFPYFAGSAAPVIPKVFSWALALGVAGGIALGLSLLPVGIGQRLAATFLVFWLTVTGWRISTLNGRGHR